MKLVIGSDKSGFSLKESVKQHLLDHGYEVTDIGTRTVEHAMPFYEVAPIAAEMVQQKKAEYGVLVCGTGMGMSQVANKYEGVLAACCENDYSAKMCRAINNSNILCMGGWMIAPELGIKMVDAFLATAHTEGLESWRAEFLKDAFAQVQTIDVQLHGSGKEVKSSQS